MALHEADVVCCSCVSRLTPLVLQACCFPVHGVMLSRARALYFKHNDMADLERVLQRVAAEDRRQQCVIPPVLLPSHRFQMSPKVGGWLRWIPPRLGELHGIAGVDAGQPSQARQPWASPINAYAVQSVPLLLPAGGREAGS